MQKKQTSPRYLKGPTKQIPGSTGRKLRFPVLDAPGFYVEIDVMDSIANIEPYEDGTILNIKSLYFMEDKNYSPATLIIQGDPDIIWKTIIQAKRRYYAVNETEQT